MEERESFEDFAPVRSAFSGCSERSAGSKSRLGREVAGGGGGGGCLDEVASGGTWCARKRTDRGANARVRAAPRKTTGIIALDGLEDF